MDFFGETHYDYSMNFCPLKASLSLSLQTLQKTKAKARVIYINAISLKIIFRKIFPCLFYGKRGSAW